LDGFRAEPRFFEVGFGRVVGDFEAFTMRNAYRAAKNLQGDRIVSVLRGARPDQFKKAKQEKAIARH